MTMRKRSEQMCFGGVQGFYTHDSALCGGPMNFAVFMPPSNQPVPALYFLAGLTCTEETFVIKAGAQRLAAELGLAIVTCDTSPRSARYPGDDESWDFGLGAGFYLDATEAPWSTTYRMETYVTQELPAVVERQFDVRADVRGIFGHSMGGHGALMLSLKHPHRYQSVSAFAPVAAPSLSPWGIKAFTRFLGPNKSAWSRCDATALLACGARRSEPLLIDVGLEDKFLVEQLGIDAFEGACRDAAQPVSLRRHRGYDHSYYFIQSFMADHLHHHARALARVAG